MYLTLLGIVADRAGRRKVAIDTLGRALELDPDCTLARLWLAKTHMPGEHYLALLHKFHDWLRPGRYVEIGVGSGDSLSQAIPPTKSIGIDPAPKVNIKFAAPTTIFPMTSDDFFREQDVKGILDKKTIDMAFIDGLHLFEAVLRDFINIERYSNPSTIVLIHDCYPIDEETSTRAQNTRFWVGDVWKIVPCLNHFRPDLDIFTILTPPSGLAVVTALDPQSNVLANRYDEAVRGFVELEYSQVCDNLDQVLNAVSNDWIVIQDRVRATIEGNNLRTTPPATAATTRHLDLGSAPRATDRA